MYSPLQCTGNPQSTQVACCYNVGSDVFVQLLYIDMGDVFRHSGTIGSVKCEGMFRLVDKTLHERNFSLGYLVIRTASVDKPRFNERTLGIVQVALSRRRISAHFAGRSQLFALSP